jgi:hypothetical protein
MVTPEKGSQFSESESQPSHPEVVSSESVASFEISNRTRVITKEAHEIVFNGYEVSVRRGVLSRKDAVKYFNTYDPDNPIREADL